MIVWIGAFSVQGLIALIAPIRPKQPVRRGEFLLPCYLYHLPFILD